MFSSYVGVAAWFVCALFAFWLAARMPRGREQIGRILVGIGALLVGVSLILPKEGPTSLPPPVMAGLIIGAGVSLLAGLVLAYPTSGLRSVVDDAKSREEAVDERIAHVLGNNGEAPDNDEADDTQDDASDDSTSDD